MNLRTESALRFEKKIDPNMTPIALEYAAELIQATAGGEIIEGILDTSKTKFTKTKIPCRWKRINQILGEEYKGKITPHSFRHYFVTTALIGSGGNIKLAQELARHKNIQVTQRYAHLSDDEIDQGYHNIFN